MMLELSRLDLLSPYPTWVDGVGSILSPTITAISRLGGEGEYNARVNTLLINKAQFLESISENLTEAQLKELDKLPLLVLLCLFDNVRDVLLDALNFFIAEDVLFSAEAACFVTVVTRQDGTTEVVGKIDADNFFEVKCLILKRNHITPPKDDAGKRRSKRMIEYDKKLEAGRKQSKKYRESQQAMSLGNIVSKVAARSSNSYRDVFDMTVYQLYDQFSEIGAQLQVNAAIRRWCTWGKDDFDFSLWYKTLSDH